LEDAEVRLLDLTHRQVVSPVLERDLALQKLSDADASYRQVAVAISETDKRVNALEKQISSLPERKTTEMRTSDNAELQQQLKSTLLNLELKRAELLTKYQPTYRLVQEIDRQIGGAKAAIAAEALAPVREQTTNSDPRYEWATTELEKARVDLSGLYARQREAACWSPPTRIWL
jgi:vacuolar-type H+-ATPase subunit D/Vma8